jgi:GT2 family glycosyltransferase/SAM-dependent methyltransferase
MTEDRTDTPALTWTGERYVPEIAGEIRLEHVHRYLIARELVPGKRVLDIACGEGYGSAILSAAATHVTGVDISPEAVAHASSKYARSNLVFCLGSCAAIPLEDHSVDVVVSFETIEHIERHDDMMREIRRVLTAEGLLVISSPDRQQYSDVLGSRNQFHVRELDRREFAHLLGSYFSHVTLAGQRVRAGSIVGPVDDAAAIRFVTFPSTNDDVTGVHGLDAPLYLVALASNQPVPRFPIGLADGGPILWPSDLSTYYAQVQGKCAVEISKRLGDAVDLEGATNEELAAEFYRQADRVSGAREQIEAINTELAATNARLEVATRALAAATAERAQLERQVLDHRTVARKAEAIARVSLDVLLGFRSSRSWRSTRAWRQGAALAREIKRRARFWKPVARAHSLPLLGSLRPSFRRQMRLMRESGLFDEAFYLKNVATNTGSAADVAAALEDPLLHYLVVGAFAGTNPHPLFDSAFYLLRNQDVASRRVNPLIHYLRAGWHEGRDPHPLFQSAFYLSQNPDVAAAKMNPLVHFVSSGGREGRDPNPWFDSSSYLNADPPLRESGENPLVHYLRIGASEERATGPLFDTRSYVRANPDVTEAGINPLIHYAIAGQMEGRSAVSAMPMPSTGDIEASIAAYHWVTTKFQEAKRSRLQNIELKPLTLVELSDRIAERARDIQLRFEPSPQVSIVIPIVNGIKLTLECLLSIVRSTQDVSFEVVVVDNGSIDQSQALLPSIAQLNYVRHDENRGFGPGCNAGAAIARGRYLVFLNNDAQVQTGWLSTLLAAFSQSDQVGAAGPKVLFPDGRLQDAGSIINMDCTSSLIGVFDDPNLPQYNRRREVDYVSGVCLVIESDRFRRMGGFDDVFAPAYCEDVDLCLRLRDQGLRAVYQPDAVIVHHLSSTSNELSPSFKMAAVVRNQQKLSDRHQAQIDGLDRTRVIAFYLPQFHPVPENDVWWGKGFTEWRNVARARPVFAGHYQPRLAGDLGFYDLRLRETYVEQIALAERYGIDGFCFYYYWFGGRRLLERPLERLLEDPTLEFPFCICWANENWTRRWDGQEREILMAQSYRDEDDVAVIDDLTRYMRHPSYIRINGRPLLLIYEASRFPDIRRTIDRWREQCRRDAIGEIYLAMVETDTILLRPSGISPREWGFDGMVEFPPHQGGWYPFAAGVDPEFRGHVYSYDPTAVRYMTRPLPGYPLFRTVMPGWDNTARRPNDSAIFAGSTPGAYQAWLECVLRQTREQHFGDEQLVFVNAWNEWAESAYLEPDVAWGHGYLEATRDARINARLRLHPD